jgi:hypothetical protein
MGQAIFSSLGAGDQASIMNEESQAQNAVFMAIAALNSQLEQLIEEVNDCPEEDQEGPFPGLWDNVSRNDAGSAAEGGTTSSDAGIDLPEGSPPDGWIHDDLGADNEGVSFFEILIPKEIN